ncbi:hypothetical protein P8452_11293 [Trifolium repens]|nr:hypothetical protein P8452_11293 [Trifolium repens]
MMACGILYAMGPNSLEEQMGCTSERIIKGDETIQNLRVKNHIYSQTSIMKKQTLCITIYIMRVSMEVNNSFTDNSVIQLTGKLSDF